MGEELDAVASSPQRDVCDPECLAREDLSALCDDRVVVADRQVDDLRDRAVRGHDWTALDLVAGDPDDERELLGGAELARQLELELHLVSVGRAGVGLDPQRLKRNIERAHLVVLVRDACGNDDEDPT